MKKKTSKSAKLRDFVCVVCEKDFKNRFSPAEIKNGRGKVCSKKCKNILISIQKTTGEYIKCKDCGENVWSRPTRPRKYCSKCWIKKSKTALSTDGYRISKGIKIHRTLMEKHISRKLLPTEIVHHINKNKLDNDIKNLKIVSRSEHNKIHKFLCKEEIANGQKT